MNFNEIKDMTILAYGASVTLFLGAYSSVLFVNLLRHDIMQHPFGAATVAAGACFTAISGIATKDLYKEIMGSLRR